MRKNLLKQLILALLIIVAVPTVNAQVAHVGDILCTSGVYVSPAEYEASGLEAMGVIFYVDATGQHGWAVALEDAGSYKWCTKESYNTPLPDFNDNNRAAIYDLNGQLNTSEVLAYSITNIYCSHPAFEALDVSSGWYLPAIGQLNYLYGNLVEVNEGLAAVDGVIFEMNTDWCYWASTECNAERAWFLHSSGYFAGSNFNSYSRKTNEHRVRGVRNF